MERPGCRCAGTGAVTVYPSQVLQPESTKVRQRHFTLYSSQVLGPTISHVSHIQVIVHPSWLPQPSSQAGSPSIVPSWKTVPRAALWTFFAIVCVKTLHSSVCLVRSFSIYDTASYRTAYKTQGCLSFVGRKSAVVSLGCQTLLEEN